MSYYIVNSETGKIWGKAYWEKKVYDTERGAKIVCTKLNKAVGNAVEWKVVDRADYVAPPVKMVERTNLMTGQKFMEPADTPWCCSPASETYWST